MRVDPKLSDVSEITCKQHKKGVSNWSTIMTMGKLPDFGGLQVYKATLVTCTPMFDIKHSEVCN